MNGRSIVPGPKYCRAGKGSLERSSLKRALLPKGASKALAGALERTLSGPLGGVKIERGASPRLTFGVLPASSAEKSRPRAPQRPQGYAMDVTPGGVFASGADEAGLFYAAVTLAGMLRDSGAAGACLIVDWPVAELRGLHLDLKGFMPTYEALLDVVDQVADLKMNLLLAEYEDKVECRSHPALAAPTALTKAQVREFVRYARERFVEVVPLLQALGHAEYILKHPEYEVLAEMPGRPQQLCPSKPKSFRLFADLAEELAELHPSGLFHIGSDETWQLGRCPKCAERSRRIGRNGLYIEHTGKVLKLVKKLGKRPMMWDDMLRKMPDEDVAKLPGDAILVYWRYQVPGGPTLAEKLPHLGRYRALGFDVVGASASKGGDGHLANMPDFARRMDNIDMWAGATDTGELKGVIATAWSRYNSYLPLCGVPESQHFPVAYAAERSWGGLARPRADFERHYAEWAHGIGHSGEAIAASLHAMNSGGRSGKAWTLELAVGEARRGGDRLRIAAALGRLEDHLETRRRMSDNFEQWTPQITGPFPRGAFGEFLERLGRLEADGIRLKTGMRKLLARSLCEDEVEEFLESRFGPTERFVARARELIR